MTRDVVGSSIGLLCFAYASYYRPAMTQTQSSAVETRIAGPSEMAGQIRRFEWSRNALGPPEQWPDVLADTLNLILCAPLAMHLFWGPELICFYNDAMATILRDKHPSAIGRPAKEVWGEAWEIVGPQLLTVYEEGRTVSMERVNVPTLTAGQMTDRFWTYTYSPIFDRQGKIVAVLDIAQDVTTEVLETRARQQSEDRLAAFVTATNDVLYVMNADWSVMSQLEGRKFLADTAKASPDWLKKYIHPLDEAYVVAAIKEAISTKGYFELEHRVLSADGSLGWTFSRAIPVLDAEGEIVEWFGAARDITDRKRAEEALRQNEKLAAVGQLASTIAHEINNPLEAVTNLLYLSKGSTTDPSVMAYLNAAEVELRRVSVITSQTLNFHRQLRSLSSCDCDEIVTNCLSVFQGRIQNASITVKLGLRAKQSVACIEGEIRQVVNNLLSNSIDAMKMGGTLHMRTVDATDWRSGARGVRIVVADTGTGMDRHTLSHIFQAFFTTKGMNGTGLGLWVTSEIVMRHQGRLLVRSSQRPGRSGSVFALFLPSREE